MTTATAPRIITDAPEPGTGAWNETITASKVPPMITLPTGEYAGYGYLTALSLIHISEPTRRS